ncbi:hypothetical protein [Lysobacter sp. HA35]
MRAFIVICWVVTLLGALIGGISIIDALNADSAPKQGAGAALACAFAIVPYVFTRAIEGMRGPQA